MALACEGERLTYRDLDVRANRLARHLRRRGVGPEVPVGVCLRRSPDLVVSLLAILKAGGAYVPLDPEYPAQRLAAMVEDAHQAAVPALVIVTRDTAECLPVRPGTRLVRLEDAGLAAAEPGVGPTPLAVGGNLAYVLYTSGSTGVPKGVAIENHSAVALIDWARRAFSPDDWAGALASTSINFDLSVFELFLPLSTGGTVVLARDVLHLAESAEAGQVTLVNTVPSAMAELVRLDAVPASVRTVNLAGEPLRAELVREIYRQPKVDRVLNLYGPSEDTTYSTGAEIPRGFAGLPPIGRPVAGSRAYLLDRWGEPVPPGVLGELHLGGPGLARGYFRQPAWTAERFGPDPFAGVGPGSRLYRTGDLARFRPDGQIEFLGRADHQVKVRGFRIELHEIEVALAAHPQIREAAVVVREDQPGDRRLVAYVVPSWEGASRSEELETVLRAHLSDSLPQYMQPSIFIVLEALPLTPNGKVDRKALPAPAARERAGAETRLSEVQELLAGIWSEVLGREGIGAGDNFFDLGGHSLLATRVISRVRTVFGIELPLRATFEQPTMAGLAERVQAAMGTGGSLQVTPLVPVDRDRPLPLSFAQQRLWFIDQLKPGSPLYNISAALRIEGPLDRAVLARCLGEIVRRHEALRTVFAAPQGVPVQVIRPAEPFLLPVVDLSAVPEGAREDLVRSLAAAEAGWPFDLASGPLLRGLLLRLDTTEELRDHVVTLTMHHIASDGWSMGILVREVAALYAAFAAGKPSPLPELPVQYADFAVWQHSWLHGELLEGEISFWRQQLAGLPSRLEFPTDRPRPAAQSFRGGARPIRLPAGLAAPAQALGRREGATLFMVLLAGFQALLARYSGQDDLAVGAPVAGRNRVEVEGLIGFFVNTLVLRGDLTGEPSFRELLGRVRDTALAAHTHQDVPFEKLIQELTPERSLAQTPLFQVMLVLQNAPMESLEIRDLRLRPFGAAGSTAKFDLTLTLEERNGALGGSIGYATDLFDAATVDRLIVYFERLLAAAVATPDLPASALPLLSAAELHEAAQGFPSIPEEGRCVHELFAEQVARAPEALAVVDEEGAWTYAELGHRVRQLALRLRAAGVGSDQPVILCAGRGAPLVAGLLGILEAGGAYLAVESELPQARLELLARDSGAAVAVTERRLAGALPDGLRRVLLDAEELDDTAGTLPAAVAPGHLAYVLYTSGSTGRPKGVMVEHRQLTAYVRGVLERLAPPPGASFATVSSFSADLGNTSIFAALLGGGCLHVVPRERLVDADAFAAGMERRPVDVLKIVPSHLAALLAAERPERALPRRLLVLGGEPLPWSLVDRVRALAPECRLFNHYGPTETTVGILTGVVEAGAVRANASAPLGRPLGATRTWVVDRHLQLVPDGLPGELCVGGPQVARGYLGRPDLTAERFVPDPLGGDAGERLYRTGDLVRQRPHGPIEFLGRIDGQVKVRGFRIEPGEIEAALLSLPGVREAAVLARDGRLVAYMAGDAAAEALRRLLRERLPDYMIPAVFVPLAALPLTPNGKLDRKALSAGAAPEQQDAGEGYLEPRTPVEEVLAGLWAELLGRERVGADDHFFDLGGHSLLATQLMSRLRSACGIEMPLRDLFEAPRLADLAIRVAAALRAGAHHPAAAPAPVPREGPLPLSFAQQQLWFIDQLEPGSPLYNVPVALRAEGPLDGAVLALCLQEIVRRHEVLRTVFATMDGTPALVIQPAAPFLLPVVDLSGLRESTRELLALSLVRDEAGRPFDLAHGPLLRGVLLRLAPRDHAVALTMHHIVSDGWSMGILVREVTALYQAFSERKPSPLPELPIQYSDFAVWQRSWLRGEAMDSLSLFWKSHLAGAPALLELPLDHKRPLLPGNRGTLRPYAIPQDLSDSLRTTARKQGATLFMILMAGFKALLSSYSGQEDIVVGANTAGRAWAELENLIGFFINMLALRTDLSGNPTLTEILQRVRKTTLEVYSRQEMPFTRVVEELCPERNLRHTPIFQVVLSVQPLMFPEELTATPELTLSRLDSDVSTTPFDLIFNLSETVTGVRGFVQYNVELFEASTITRLMERYTVLLRMVTEEPELRLSEIREKLFAGLLSGERERDFAVASRRAFKSARRQAVAIGTTIPD
ncbi:MAG TPA: amino acid adenylation domain-containing protein [Thermoanaerobaculia bacterium]|nr:amino acid adenylation domain-containing protein [Thermoanaerobaculia bacterium]